MSFSLSFSEDFFGSPEDLVDITKPPATVCAAIKAIPDEEWEEICEQVFWSKPEEVEWEDILDQIKTVNTCSNLDSPVRVWIDEQGYYTVDVHEEADVKKGRKQECNHEPDFSSIAHSDKAVGDLNEECILDVNCRHCGRSGAFRVDTTTEIDW